MDLGPLRQLAEFQRHMLLVVPVVVVRVALRLLAPQILGTVVVVVMDHQTLAQQAAPV